MKYLLSLAVMMFEALPFLCNLISEIQALIAATRKSFTCTWSGGAPQVQVKGFMWTCQISRTVPQGLIQSDGKKKNRDLFSMLMCFNYSLFLQLYMQKKLPSQRPIYVSALRHLPVVCTSSSDCWFLSAPFSFWSSWDCQLYLRSGSDAKHDETLRGGGHLAHTDCRCVLF